MNLKTRSLLLSLLGGMAATASCGNSEEAPCQPLACRSSLVIKYSREVTGLYRVAVKAAAMTHESSCPASLPPLMSGIACDAKEVRLVGIDDPGGPVMVTLQTVDGKPIASGMVTTTAGPGSMMNACSSCSIRDGTLTW